MDYTSYYGEPFRADLAQLASVHEAAHVHPEQGLLIQPRMLARDSNPIAGWSADRLRLFAAAMFYTVLVDQVAYTYFRSTYDECVPGAAKEIFIPQRSSAFWPAVGGIPTEGSRRLTLQRS